MVPSAGSSSPRSSRRNVVLPLPFGPTSPTFDPAVRTKFSPLKSLRSPISHATSLNSTSRFVLRCVASKSMPAVFTVVRESIAASCPIISLAESIRAFDFVVRAFGPRRSHSISVRTRLRKLSCCLLCDSR